MVKKVGIIALDPRASAFYGKQVRELFGGTVEVRAYSVQEGEAAGVDGSLMSSLGASPERCDLYMISTDAFDNRDDVPRYIPIDSQICEIHVTYLWEAINRLREIPAGTRALFVNMTEKMAREATTMLNQLGVNHIDFTPFYPGAAPVSGIDLAVTTDEERYVPRGIRKVVNIGHRCCTSETMIEVALKLGLEELLETEPFRNYFSRVATSTYNFDRMFDRSRRLESQFDMLMEILDEGIIGVNERGEIFAMNQKGEEITGLSRVRALHSQASAVLAGIPFGQCLKTKRPVGPKVVPMGGVNVGVTVAPVLRREDCIGAFATLQRFNDSENRQQELRSQLMHKGSRARYTFDDVIGESQGILRTKEILGRMAQTESPVLLIGETGTGKELLAHAVHLASRRKDGPLVAINCAAMPENLLESELFGYEEGAFTGAKKGGRPGLFEFAHHGTLFLDEVEGMSQALQVKLLRVLQEHEIMRVGGHKIIRVSVRIVAATNESLEAKVKDGSFRRDLYYRLNTLPVLIPPLRERGDDVFLLLEHFRREIQGEFVLSQEVRRLFKQYSWPGNIRELHNLAQYFSFTGSPVITVQDLPPTFVFEGVEGWEIPPSAAGRPSAPGGSPKLPPWEQAMKDRRMAEEDYLYILRELYQYAEEGRTVGREGILKQAREDKLVLSQATVRTVIGILRDYGLVRGGRGRGGNRITSYGKKVWQEKKSGFDIKG